MKRRNKKIYFDQPIQVTGVGSSGQQLTPGEQTTVEPTVLDSPGFIIPFMSGKDSGQRTCTTSGVPTRGVIEGFGQSSASDAKPAISSNGTFSLDSDTCYSFIMPCDAMLDGIAVNVLYSADTSTKAIPFVAIATADPETNNFVIQNSSRTYTEPYPGANVTEGGTFTGRQRNINLPITAGTKVAIITSTTSTSGSVDLSFSMNGSLLFKPMPDNTSKRLPSMVTPFTTGRTTPTLTCRPDQGSTSELCVFIGFGDCNSTSYSFGYGYNMETGEATQHVDPSGNTSFAFRTATDITSVDIYMDIILTLNYTFSSGAILKPYVALAICDSDSNIFTVIPETKTEVSLLRGTTYTQYTVLKASKTGIPVEIPKNSRVAIVGAFYVQDSTAPSTPLSLSRWKYTGGVALY